MNDAKSCENEEALRDFLLDIECLDELLPWTRRVNLFDILKISRILKKPGPFSGVFHVGSCLAFIHIKAHKRPVRTERNGINELLLMKEQVVLISGLIEKADVDSDPIMCIGTGIFMLQAFEP